jgi:para-aminobenzoate synthetase
LESKLGGHVCTFCPQGETGEAGLPFEFLGGWVGYLGYELRAECLPHTAARRHASATPDAAIFFVTRFIALDHDTGDAFVVASCSASDDTDALPWVSAMAERVGHVNSAAVSQTAGSPPVAAPAVWDGDACDAPAGAFLLRVGREGYKADVRACMEHIAAGDTYEVCLTTALERPQGGIQPFELYARLRHGNPAPYAAFMRVGGSDTGDDLAVCCSSPERFLRVDKHRRVEAKPIKGTAARVQPHGCPDDVAAGEELRQSVKDRAENLMIVDLLRNDLGRVCCPGTVHVPALCAIESFASVHQLVSTVRGALSEGVSTVAAVRACFPGGSMTGAPKLRTCNIIDAIEPGPRGVYSGALGFLSIDGAADLNIVIRTAVLHDATITVGAGGAVVALSDAEAEYAEMRLKARAVLAAVAAAASGTA